MGKEGLPLYLYSYFLPKWLNLAIASLLALRNDSHTFAMKVTGCQASQPPTCQWAMFLAWPCLSLRWNLVGKTFKCLFSTPCTVTLANSVCFHSIWIRLPSYPPNILWHTHQVPGPCLAWRMQRWLKVSMHKEHQVPGSLYFNLLSHVSVTLENGFWNSSFQKAFALSFFEGRGLKKKAPGLSYFLQVAFPRWSYLIPFSKARPVYYISSCLWKTATRLDS